MKSKEAQWWTIVEVVILGMTSSIICSIYENRPGQCAAFPINEDCLADVNFDCTYSFAPAQAFLQIETAD